MSGPGERDSGASVGGSGGSDCRPGRIVLRGRGEDRTESRGDEEDMTHNCGSCIWAQWPKEAWSKHSPPRLLNFCGKCTWPEPNIGPIPACIKPIRFYRGGIWPVAYEDCPTWKDKHERG